MAMFAWFLIIFVGIFGLIGIAVAVLRVVGEWKVLEKAGKPGWISIIPYYNCWTFYEISGVNPLLSLFLLGGNVLSFASNILNYFVRVGDSYNFALSGVSIIFSLSSVALSIASIVFTVISCIRLAKCFGKEGAYGFGLAFLGFIFYPMLGFDKNATYKK